MSTQATSGNYAAVAKNNGGTVIGAGAIVAGSPITKDLSIAKVADDIGVYGASKVLFNDGTGAATTDRVGISGAVSSIARTGIARTASSTEWVIRGVSTTLAGAANTALHSRGRDYNGSGALVPSIHKTVKTQKIGVGTFDVLAHPSTDITPCFTKGAGAGNDSNFVRPSGNGLAAAVDDAATPSRSIPGELTYMFGGVVPSGDRYKPRNSYE